MHIFFIEPSALVKGYVNEDGSAWVVRLMDQAQDGELVMAKLAEVEVVAALARLRKANGRRTAELDGAIAAFLADCSAKIEVVHLSDSVHGVAIAMARKHALRAYDAVHLASALCFRDRLSAYMAADVVLVSADDELLAAARAEGLGCENPLLHAKTNEALC